MPNYELGTVPRYDAFEFARRKRNPADSLRIAVDRFVTSLQARQEAEAARALRESRLKTEEEQRKTAEAQRKGFEEESDIRRRQEGRAALGTFQKLQEEQRQREADRQTAERLRTRFDAAAGMSDADVIRLFGPGVTPVTPAQQLAADTQRAVAGIRTARTTQPGTLSPRDSRVSRTMSYVRSREKQLMAIRTLTLQEVRQQLTPDQYMAFLNDAFRHGRIRNQRVTMPGMEQGAARTQAIDEALQEFGPLFTEEELPQLRTFISGLDPSALPGEPEPVTPPGVLEPEPIMSPEEVHAAKAMVDDASTIQTKIQRLRAAGFTDDEIAYILGQ